MYVQAHLAIKQFLILINPFCNILQTKSAFFSIQLHKFEYFATSAASSDNPTIPAWSWHMILN